MSKHVLAGIVTFLGALVAALLVAQTTLGGLVASQDANTAAAATVGGTVPTAVAPSTDGVAAAPAAAARSVPMPVWAGPPFYEGSDALFGSYSWAGGAVVWCEDVSMCSTTIASFFKRWPDGYLVANVVGHHSNCAEHFSSFDPSTADPDHWDGGWDNASCALWLRHGRDADGDGPDAGIVPYKADHAYGNGQGWADLDSAGHTWASHLQPWVDSGTSVSLVPTTSSPLGVLTTSRVRVSST